MWGRWGYPALLVLLVAALYGQYLWNPIVFDDLYLFLADATGHQPIMDMRFNWAQFRSLPYVTITWTQALLGSSLIYFRLGNLALHAATVLALYVCVVQLRKALRLREMGANSVTGASAGSNAVGIRVSDYGPAATLNDHSMAALGAMIFALHPVAVYAAGYLVQRTMLMATLFSLLAMSVYVRGLVQNQAVWLWATVPLYYAAVFSKEHAIMLAVIFPLISFALTRARGRRLPSTAGTASALGRDPWPVWVTLLLMALVVAVLRRQFVGNAYEIDAQMLAEQGGLEHPYLSSALTQTWLFFRYVATWLVPNIAWMSVDIRVPFASTPFSLYGVSALAYLAWGGAGAWLVWRGGRTALFGLALLFAWLMGWTELATVRLQEPFVLYRSYLWAAGALAFLAALPTFTLVRKHLVAVALLTLVLFGLSMERLQTFSHPYLLWDDAARLLEGRENVAGAYRIYYNRGSELLKAKQFAPAIQDLEKAIQLQPNFAPGFGNLGVAYLESGKFAQALTAFNQALEAAALAGQRPDARYYLGRARAYEGLNNPTQARQDYESACQQFKAGCDKLH